MLVAVKVVGVATVVVAVMAVVSVATPGCKLGVASRGSIVVVAVVVRGIAIEVGTVVVVA